MKNKKRLSHLLECKSVITSDDANKCPLCRVRAAGPDLLAELIKIVRLHKTGRALSVNLDNARALIKKAGGK